MSEYFLMGLGLAQLRDPRPIGFALSSPWTQIRPRNGQKNPGCRGTRARGLGWANLSFRDFIVYGLKFEKSQQNEIFF